VVGDAFSGCCFRYADLFVNDSGTWEDLAETTDLGLPFNPGAQPLFDGGPMDRIVDETHTGGIDFVAVGATMDDLDQALRPSVWPSTDGGFSLFVSGDGGNSWSDQLGDFSGGSIMFGDGVALRSTSTDSRRTLDGENWEQIPGPPPDPFSCDCDYTDLSGIRTLQLGDATVLWNGRDFMSTGHFWVADSTTLGFRSSSTRRSATVPWAPPMSTRLAWPKMVLSCDRVDPGTDDRQQIA